MEFSSHLSSVIHSSPIQVPSSDSGYSTPPRSTTIPKQTSINSSFSQLFHQPKLLTSAELKRRFSPIHSSNKKRRQHLIRKHDCIVPLERNLNVPVISQTFLNAKEEFSPISMHADDSIVPRSCFNSSILSSKRIHPRPTFDDFISHSSKIGQENSFSISETIMKEKLKALLQQK